MTVAVKPGLSKCSPERDADHQRTTRWFQGWCVENGVTVDDLRRVLGLRSTATAYAKWTGKSPLSLLDIGRFSSRHRHQLTSMWLSWRDSIDRETKNAAHG